MNRPIIDIQKLSFSYRGSAHRALKNITYTHYQGEFTAVMGATGAGKSTLCRCLNGLIPSFIKGSLEGQITLHGETLNTPRVYEIARQVGLVFQDFEAQLFSTNVELEVAFGLENFAVDPNDMSRRVSSVLERVGLKGFGVRDPSTLSGGEKQRLAIASVLVANPTIMIMDEPTTDLDPVGKREIFRLAAEMRKEIEGVILVEHETEHVISADRLVILDRGEMTFNGAPGEILRDPDILEKNGIRPLQTTQLLRRLGLPSDTLDINSTVQAIKEAGWRINHKKADGLKSMDKNRYSTDTVIDISHLVHRYEQDAPPAVDEVSLRIGRGEFVAIVGQNGCGKTTLVKHLNGLHRPAGGRIQILGKDSTQWTLSDLGRRVGYVFQNPDHQIFANTLFDEVAFGPRNFGVPKSEIESRVFHALQVVGLTGQESQDPFSLTKGERQKLAVASVLASDPEVLILDEPTTGLDYHGQRAVLDLIRRLNRDGRTIIMVTHSMWIVAEYADRCIMMSRGKIVSDTDVRACFQDLERLESLSLEAPEAVRLGYHFGVPVRSINELHACLVKMN